MHVNGRWCYLYRASIAAGATIDFRLSALRDAGLFRQALNDPSHPQPRVIHTDEAGDPQVSDSGNQRGRNAAEALSPPAGVG